MSTATPSSSTHHKKIEIYTTPWCPFCIRAKKFLEQKGLAFQEYDVSADHQLRQKMMTRADGRHTVPQIFIGDRGIGGCDDMLALERKGQFDDLVNNA